MTSALQQPDEVLDRLGLSQQENGLANHQPGARARGTELRSINPTTGEVLATVVQASEEDYEETVRGALEVFQRWRTIPAPARGEIVRQVGNALREHRAELGALVSLEMGKIRAEGEGEVQEAIDMADFAVGLSRQLYGLSMHSERPSHRMYEQWHPLGAVGIVTAFNFPVAVWAWNAMVALVCGDVLLWKPSSETPLISIATHRLLEQVLDANGWRGVSSLLVGRGSTVGECMLQDRRVPLVSATGSCDLGRHIGQVVGGRLGRSILELGGNNGIVVTADANLDLATRAILFGAVGTAGQRCTTTRRLFLEGPIAEELTGRLISAYGSVRIGNPLEEGVLMGPLVNQAAVDDHCRALELAREQGGEILYGGKALDRPGFFVEPTIVRAHPGMEIVREETFAPILYVFTVGDLQEAIELHNSVDQGLSSSIFTTSLQAAERFLSPAGSDCGIANVNIGTSGAEIGGAFGGEKDTGGGREAGSDSWKAYMRRQTCTINWGDELPLAQGIQFG